MDQAKYADLSKVLMIDLLRIDREVAVTPQRIQEAAELAITVGDEERAAKFALDVITAEAGSRLRSIPMEGGKPRSEASIERELILEPDVQAARMEYENARSNAAKCRALSDNMREKSRLLGKACDMTIAGFISPASYARKPLEKPGEKPPASS
jgi:hypothetical protein